MHNVEARSDIWQVEVEVLESLDFDPLRPSSLASFPLPALARSGRSETIEIPLIVLENGLIQATFCPSLGGRLLAFDSSIPASLALKDGGVRGVRLDQGFWFSVGLQDRLSGLGPVDFSVDEDEESASVTFFWLVPGEDASAQVRYEMQKGFTGLIAEARVSNRSLAPLETAWCWRHSPPEGTSVRWFGDVCVLGDLTLEADGLPVVGSLTDEGYVGSPYDGPLLMAPRAQDSCRLLIRPTGFGGAENAGFGSKGALAVQSETIVVEALEVSETTRLWAKTEDGQTLEAPLKFGGKGRMEIPLAALPARPERLVWLDSAKTVLAEWPQQPSPTPSLIPAPRFVSEGLEHLRSDNLRAALAFWELRPAARVALAHADLAQNNPKAASQHLAEALNQNAEDVLAWWLKAVAERVSEIEGDRPELANAHFLCPMDPVLRAEALLSQPLHEGSGANPLLEPLKDDVEGLIEPAVRLLEAGLFEQGARYLDEAMRWNAHPRLVVLYAWALLKKAGMATEAANFVSRMCDLTPPYPWRTFELNAAEELARRFPSSKVKGLFQKFGDFRELGESDLP